MAAKKSGHERDVWKCGCSLTLALCDAALGVFGAALDNDSMTPLCFAFCLWLSVCPSSSLTFRIQLITNFTLNTQWDCTFSGLERREDCEQDPSQGKTGWDFRGLLQRAVAWRGIWRRWLPVCLWSIRALLGMGRKHVLLKWWQDFCFIVGLMSWLSEP